MTACLTAPVVRTPRGTSWLTTVDLTATLLFALEGALLAIAGGLDLFGVLVVAFISSLGGGLVRDLLCHATPPAALNSFIYPATALLGGLLAVLGHQVLTPVPLGVRAPLDAAALGLFCVVGTIKALDFRMRPLAAVMLGAVSAFGGGVIRDVLLGGVPAALRTDMCAVAAVCGGTVTVLALRLGQSRATAAALGFATCAAVSLVSAVQGWHLPPVAGQPG
jgi:uncharacterized membrane protein YeiH